MRKFPQQTTKILISIFGLALLLSACRAEHIESEISTQIVPVADQVTASSPVPTSESASDALEPVVTVGPTPQRDTTDPYATSDRPDDASGYQIHFIYALPNDGTDDFLDINGRIELSANAMNNWFEGETGSRLRYDTYQGQLDISFMRLDYSADQISDIEEEIVVLMDYEIKTRGFDSLHKLYVIHYDGFFVSSKGFCGLAQFPPDGAGVSSVLLLRGYNPTLDLTCPRSFTKSADYTGYFEMTILHELLHLLGMVPDCAPNANNGHVFDNEQDLMYHQYDGSYSPIYTYLDYHNNDYFNHNDPNCPDLAHSVFLEPLPEDAQTPPGWEISSTYIPENPVTNP